MFKSAQQQELERLEKNRVARIIAKRVGKLRKPRLGLNELSTQALAHQSGLAQSAVSDIINGKVADVKMYTLLKLCRTRGVTLSEFFQDFEEEL